jgi:flagellar biosynthesis/type III secretory pathway M-ring protein FliF/YscJ
VDSILYGFWIAIANCLYNTNKLGGNMGKLKTMWKDMSMTGKIVLAIVVVAAVVVAYNAII